jgi:hypothetical protein
MVVPLNFPINILLFIIILPFLKQNYPLFNSHQSLYSIKSLSFFVLFIRTTKSSFYTIPHSINTKQKPF